MLAFYKVAYKIAKYKKSHTIAEELILPAAVDIVPLSNNTVSYRINQMAVDINDQLIEKIKNKVFGLQLDEATDNNEDAQLIRYMSFIDGDEMIEELLFCKSITSAKSQNLFEIIDNFISGNNLD